jgi:ferredoxin
MMTGTLLLNTLQFRAEQCTGCGMCSAVCPHGVFAQRNHVAELVRREACMECGACELNCPSGAISVQSGVGCASAMIHAALTGAREETCGGSAACCGPGPVTSESIEET